MKLEKLLAENMLRFGVKNLNNSAVEKLTHLLEQTAPGTLPKSVNDLLDSPEVKAAPGYDEVIGRLIKLANKGKHKVNVTSLKYWQGSAMTQNPDVKYTDMIINALPKINTYLETPGLAPQIVTNLKAKLPAFEKLVALLADNKKNNIYIKIIDNLPYTQRACLNLMKTPNPAAIKLAVDEILGTNSLNQINALVTNFAAQRNGTDLISKTVISEITDADKLDLLKTALIQLEEEKKKGAVSSTGQGVSVGGVGMGAVSRIIIAPSTEIEALTRTVSQEVIANPEPVVVAVTYPDVKIPNNTEAQNFFGDNISQVTPEQKQLFAERLATAVTALKAKGVTITEIRYNSGASTSKVFTKYLGPGKLAATSSAANNIPLVNDRLASIDATLKRVIEENPDVNKVKIVKLQSDPLPNQGPEYKRGQWNFGIDGKIVPNEKAAYEAMYAPHRYSFGAFILIGNAVPPAEEKETVTYTGQGKWRIKLVWDKLNIFPPLRPASGGTVSLFPTDGNPIKCPSH
jgi:hypothetical protein